MSGLSSYPRSQSAYLGHVYMKNVCVQFFKKQRLLLFLMFIPSLTYLHNFFSHIAIFMKEVVLYFMKTKTKTAKTILLGDTELLSIS